MKPLIITIIALGLFQTVKGQTINWKTIDSSKHIVTAGFEWDYSLSYSAGYGYKLNTKLPIVLSLNFTKASGENLLDDFKTKIGGQIVLLNQPTLKGVITLNGIYRRFENDLVRLQNIGSELKGTFGYYKPKWLVACEVGFDKAILTHFKHSDTYKKDIYQNVKDGWYEPATGGNFSYGLQTGYSFKKSDITLNFGKVITQDFKTTPLIPFYLRLGYNYKFR